MDDGGNLKKTWILVHEGSIVKNHSIECLAFANIITNIQRAVDTIGISKYGKDYNKEDCRLYFNELKEGSVAVPAYPLSCGTDLNGEMPYLKIMDCFESLLTTLSNDPNKFESQLNEEISDTQSRIGFIKSIIPLTQLDSQIEIKSAVKQPKHGSLIPNYQNKYLNELLFELGASGILTIHGVIMGIRGDKKRYFILKSKNNQTIKCYYTPELESTVKELYKKWVYVTGNLVHKQKTSHLEYVTDIEEQQSEFLSQIGRYPLKKPVEFKTDYDLEDNLWGLVNDELALNGYGTNYKDTISSLEEELEGHVLSFTKYPDERHSDGSLKIKVELKKYVDFKTVLAEMDKKYGAE